MRLYQAEHSWPLYNYIIDHDYEVYSTYITPESEARESLSTVPFHESNLFIYVSSRLQQPPPPTYTINGNPIKCLAQHKDLGVTFTSDFSRSAHYNNICTKAYQTLGLIRRTFQVNSAEAKKRLYLALVRSQLLYCSQLLRPQLIRDITALERIQRRATKYILNDYTSSYKLRLEQLHLLPLMYHYKLQDILFLIKSLKSPTDNFNIYNYITFARGNTRSGINQKLNHPRTSSVTQHHFYFNRIARLYNYLPVIDLSLSTNTIKYRLTNYLWSHFTNNFNPERACTFHLLCPCHRCSRAPLSTNFNKL